MAVYKRPPTSVCHPSPSKQFKFLHSISESESTYANHLSELSHDFDYASCSDLVDLPVITEAEILKCLKKRYENDRIYTSMRNHLTSMNPGRSIPELYAPEKMTRVGVGEAHIFSLGANALKSVVHSDEGGNAFIVISGESGSGKTENAKYLLKYFIHHNVNRPDFDASFLESSLVHMFSVLEAFGNAPTAHNRNSSRFGKCVRIEYLDEQRRIGGVNVNTFLLEKTRVLHLKHSPSTCFHVFESMLSMPPEQREQLFVEPEEEEEPTRAPFIAWRELEGALEALRLAPEDRQMMARTLSALRLFARLRFVGEERLMAEGESELQISRIALLLGARLEELKRTLTQHTFASSRRESVYIRSCSPAEAEARVATLMKFVYQLLFHWITRFCERQFACQGQRSISIIDLYGFESLAVNGFEQLCINFANERLQEFFLDSFVRATVADYENEGVPFNGATSCRIESLETSGMIARGLFPLLEEECRMRRLNATPERLASRIQAELLPRHPSAVLGVDCAPVASLLVRHYAGTVRYELADFLPLNVDRMPSDVFDFLAGSAAGRWLMALRSELAAEREAAARRLKQRPAVSAQFHKNLEAMLGLLASSRHVAYVRCLKPRSDVGLVPAAGQFDAHLVQRQLASCGVTGTVRVCKEASHSVRLPYELFHRRFAVLLSATLPPAPTPASPALFADLESSFLAQHELPRTPTRSCRRSVRRRTCASEVDELRRVCAAILERAGLAPSSAQFGRSRLFLTEPQSSCLDDALRNVRHRAARVLQAATRRWLRRRTQTAAAVVLQRNVRRWLANRRVPGPQGDVTPPEPPEPPDPPSAPVASFQHRRRNIVSRRFIPTSPVSVTVRADAAGRAARRDSLVRHRLLPYSNLRPLNSVPRVHASYKLSITNCL